MCWLAVPSACHSAHAHMDTYMDTCPHPALPHLTPPPLSVSPPRCTAAVHTVHCVLHTPEQGGACQPEPQHTVHSQGHQDAAGGPQQGAGLTARAAAGKVAKADAGLCSSTAGMRSCSNQPPASTLLKAADCSNKPARIAFLLCLKLILHRLQRVWGRHNRLCLAAVHCFGGGVMG